MTFKRLLTLSAAAGLVWAGRNLLRASRRISFTGKVVVITGGSRGLGLVLARKLAAEGARLAICSRTEHQVNEARTELSAYGIPVLAQVVDLTNKAQLQAFFANVRAELGPVDVLINNAGIISAGPYNALDEADYARSLDTHFWAPFHAIMAVLPQMRERGEGRIVNIASIGGKVAVPHLLPYSVGKFALTGFSEGLRAELAKDNVLVTTICPGLLRTGSHLNAQIKGQHELEYKLFKAADGAPFSSTAAEDAADEILDAARHGEAERVISNSARAAVLLHGLSPSLVIEGFALLDRLLPAAQPGSTQLKRGHELEPAPTLIGEQALAQAADQNNER